MPSELKWLMYAPVMGSYVSSPLELQDGPHGTNGMLVGFLTADSGKLEMSLKTCVETVVLKRLAMERLIRFASLSNMVTQEEWIADQARAAKIEKIKKDQIDTLCDLAAKEYENTDTPFDEIMHKYISKAYRFGENIDKLTKEK